LTGYGKYYQVFEYETEDINILDTWFLIIE